jgi:DnaK suppressor protein
MESDVQSERQAALTGERDQVREQLAQLGHDREIDSFDDGFADSGQVTAERGEVEALVASLLETLDDVEHALAKIEAGEYGNCESCQQPIPGARLDALPAARECITCASKRR